MVLDEITTYLNAQGVAVSGTNLFYGPMKEGYPSAVTVVQLYGGMQDEPNLGDSSGTAGSNFGRATRMEFPRIQVLCRGVRDDTDGPRAAAAAARAALVKVLNTTLSGVRYLAIEALQPPFRLMADENLREYYAVNFQVYKELS